MKCHRQWCLLPLRHKIFFIAHLLKNLQTSFMTCFFLDMNTKYWGKHGVITYPLSCMPIVRSVLAFIVTFSSKWICIDFIVWLICRQETGIYHLTVLSLNTGTLSSATGIPRSLITIIVERSLSWMGKACPFRSREGKPNFAKPTWMRYLSRSFFLCISHCTAMELFMVRMLAISVHF